MEELAPEPKGADKDRKARADKLRAVHTQLRSALPNYDRYHRSSAVGPLFREQIQSGGHVWMRYAAAEMDMWYLRPMLLEQATKLYAHIEDKITPMQMFRQLQFFSKAIAKAKKRAREVLITLLLVRHRLGAHVQAPTEILQKILSHVNEEECGL
jgi:hypothetical protein